MPLTNNQKQQIKKILSSKLEEKIKSFAEQEDMNKPFYFCLFSKEIVFTGSLLQSIYTWLGGQWEDFAAIIAQNNFSTIRKHYKLQGRITSMEQVQIDNILKDLESGDREISIEKMKNELEKAYDTNDNVRNTSQTIDLYLEKDNDEFFLELKSVKPNKNEMRAAKQDLLNVIAMRQKVKPQKNIHAFLVMPFNSYFSGKYRRWTVTKFFKEGDDLIVGKGFWDFIGGDGAYEELLKIFQEVGKEAMKSIKETIKKMENCSDLEKYMQ